MINEITKPKVLSSLFWKLMERGGTQGIQFFVMIVLARLLLPKEFGLIALVSFFVTVSGVIVQSGFNTALIQKKDVDDIDYSSVFYLNVFVASLLYTVLFFSSPFISNFFEEPQLLFVMRVLSLTLFFGAINSVQYSVISRNMEFKKQFLSSLGAIVISGTVGVIMAFADLGVWALVGQQITNQFFATVILWFSVKWRPRLLFSMKRIKSLFSFGWKLLVASLIDTLYMNVRSLIIGKMFSPAILGFYNRGEQFPSLIVSNINGSIQSVMLPTLAFHQDNRQKVKDITRRAIVTSSFIIFPMMVGLAVIAEPLVKILLSEKWLSSVPFLQILCVSYAFWPIHTANLQAINALGRSDIFLKLEIIKKIIGISILGVSIFYGVYAIALGTILSGFISSIINAFPNLKLLNYSYKEQLCDVMPSFLLSLVMGVVVYSINWFPMPDSLLLISQLIIGISLYVTLAKIFNLESYNYLIETFKFTIKKRSLT